MTHRHETKAVACPRPRLILRAVERGEDFRELFAGRNGRRWPVHFPQVNRKRSLDASRVTTDVFQITVNLSCGPRIQSVALKQGRRAAYGGIP